MTQGVGPSGLSWADGLWVVPGLRVRRQVRPGTTGGAVPVFTTARRAADYLARLSRDGLAVLHVPPAEVGATLAGFVERGESRLVIDPRQADARSPFRTTESAGDDVAPDGPKLSGRTPLAIVTLVGVD